MILLKDRILWEYIAFAMMIVAAFIIWFKYGKEDRIVPTDEFYPPNNLTPTDVGYIIDGMASSRHSVAMLLAWADKGYIQLIEKSKKEILIIKKGELPQNAQEYEQILFSGLFKHAKSISLEESNQTMMGVSTKELRNNFYNPIEKVKKKMGEKYKKNKEQPFYTKSSMNVKPLVGVLTAMPIILSGYFTIFFMFTFVTALFFVGAMYLLGTVVKKRRSLPFGSWIGNVLFVSIFVVVVVVLCARAPKRFDDSGQLRMVAIVTSFIIGWFFIFMDKRTDDANHLLAKGLGLKQFIRTAEKDRLRTLLVSNPNYFYDLLPYAYVLGEIKTWGKRFETINIEPPSWYTRAKKTKEFSTTTFTARLAHSMAMIDKATTSPSSGSHSSGRSGGSHSPGGGRW